jgi:hypothetical protein
MWLILGNQPSISSMLLDACEVGGAVAFTPCLSRNERNNLSN